MVHRHRADGQFPQRQMQVGDGVLGHSNLQDAQASRNLVFKTVVLYLVPLYLEGQLSLKILGSGMQHIAGCLGLLARSSDWSCVCLCMPDDLNGELDKLI